MAISVNLNHTALGKLLTPMCTVTKQYNLVLATGVSLSGGK